MVVTGARVDEPLWVVVDPKASKQPIPAHDGAEALKTIPGFGVIRKGGTDGDPVLRGAAGSRLNLLLGGEQILGGCGSRMDPPTAYVFPETYDKVTVIKGPQTVLYGPGNSAGTVLFERQVERFEKPDFRLDASATFGSFGRNDQVLSAEAGVPEFYGQAQGTRSASDDYKDGAGRAVHSEYMRWSTGGAIGWTPSERTRLELSAIKSDGRAAYADRSMDGVSFDRENLGLKFETGQEEGPVEKFSAQVYHNDVDHVMDNYTLRTPPSNTWMVSNPDRETTGARIALALRAGDSLKLTLGADGQKNTHTLRSGMTLNATAPAYDTKPRAKDAEFWNAGVFGEATWSVTETSRLIGGLRVDQWHARDERATLALGSGMMAVTAANPTAGQSRDEMLPSGFARVEHDLAKDSTLYAGLGRSERFPDYWELISAGKESAASTSAFASTKTEKNTQLDAGWTHQDGPARISVSGFYSRVEDYILIQSNVAKPMPGRLATVTRNVDAETWGGEVSGEYAFAREWKADGSLACVYGRNKTDGTAMAQLPPLEARLGLGWDNGTFSAGSLLRLVAEQDRFDRNKGNIVGQDIGPTNGFAIFSLNAGYKPTKNILITGGVDNLFNKSYAEHISRGGASVTGFAQTTRVNEPGRMFWLKARFTLR